jgi:protein tyrosine/serine phosphatase
MQNLVISISILLAFGNAALAGGSDSVPIYNFHQVHPGIFRGGEPIGAKAMDFLRAKHVKTDIDLQSNESDSKTFGETPAGIASERQMANARGIVFVSAPMDASVPVDANVAFQIFSVLGQIHDPSHQPVYVHCLAGKDRTGLVMALYRVAYDGWSIEDAHDEMLKYGHIEKDFPNMDIFFYAAAPFLVIGHAFDPAN